ncbi:MAG: hypothetical protein IPO63_11940 [Bacteroidetes bacterium]|nr:hypothetical protein [Bacteroidota bacterium]
MISRQNEILLSGTSYSTLSGDKTEMNLGAEQTWMVLCDTSGNKILDKTFFTTGHDEYGQVISDFRDVTPVSIIPSPIQEDIELLIIMVEVIFGSVKYVRSL